MDGTLSLQDNCGVSFNNGWEKLSFLLCRISNLSRGHGGVCAASQRGGGHSETPELTAAVLGDRIGPRTSSAVPKQ